MNVPALGVGLDEAWDRASIAELQAYRAEFVCRYLGEDTTGKNLTRAEADAYRAAGIKVVSNYEYAPGSALKGFLEGQRVARIAAAQHRACGGAATDPIFFSVDVDVTSAQLPTIGAYLDGINTVLGRGRLNRWRGAAYGEYEVIRYLFDTGRIGWGWQTYAWSGAKWEDRAQLRQVANGIHVAGHDVDRDENWTIDFGQWEVAGMELSDRVSGTASVSLDHDRTVDQVLGDVHRLWGVLVGDRAGDTRWPIVAALQMLNGDGPVTVATRAHVVALAGEVGKMRTDLLAAFAAAPPIPVVNVVAADVVDALGKRPDIIGQLADAIAGAVLDEVISRITSAPAPPAQT